MKKMHESIPLLVLGQRHTHKCCGPLFYWEKIYYHARRLKYKGPPPFPPLFEMRKKLMLIITKSLAIRELRQIWVINFGSLEKKNLEIGKSVFWGRGMGVLISKQLKPCFRINISLAAGCSYRKDLMLQLGKNAMLGGDYHPTPPRLHVLKTLQCTWNITQTCEENINCICCIS